jgi:hypothetical protein
MFVSHCKQVTSCSSLIERKALAFKFLEKGLQFRSKFLITLYIAQVGLFLLFLTYAIHNKCLDAIGFVSASLTPAAPSPGTAVTILTAREGEG